MLWLKRIICGIVALIFIFIGARLIHGGEQVWQAIGFAYLSAALLWLILPLSSSFPNIISGLRLRQQGWLTLYILHITKRLDKKKKLLMPGWNMNWKKPKLIKTGKTPRKEQKKKRETGFDPSAYPKISGSANVIHAHVFI